MWFSAMNGRKSLFPIGSRYNLQNSYGADTIMMGIYWTFWAGVHTPQFDVVGGMRFFIEQFFLIERCCQHCRSIEADLIDCRL